MSIKVDLHFALQTPSGEVSALTFRRGKARDMLAAQRLETDPKRLELVLMAMLTEERVTPEDLEDLDLADMAAVQAAFSSLFAYPAAARAVAGDGSAGPVVPLATK